jgi:hypothetical protein
MTIDDRRLGYHVVATMAHTHGLAHAGLLSMEQAAEALAALAEIVAAESTATETGTASDSAAQPVDPRAHLTGRLAARLGDELAALLRAGRADHDQRATVFRLWTRDAILDTGALLVDLRQALTDLAERSDTALATGSQPPVLFGHYLIAYVEQLYRDGNRLKEVYVRADILPLGAGDGAGVEVALDRGYVARLLGMHANTRNSIDGVGDRDFVIECLAALALLGTRLARLIGDPVLQAAVAPDPGLLSSEVKAGAQELARVTSEEWQTALVTLSRIPQGYDPTLGQIGAALARAVERTQEALRLAIHVVREAPVPPTDMGGLADLRGTSADPALTSGSPAGSLDRFVSRGGTAPVVASSAIMDTHGRIGTYRQWIAERRAAHATVEALRRFPAERVVTLLPHNDLPAAPRA